jgi:hypothetical protein
MIMSKTQEIGITEFLNGSKNITGVFEVTAKHIEGTEMCSVELPCKYKDKNITVAVYE